MCIEWLIERNGYENWRVKITLLEGRILDDSWQGSLLVAHAGVPDRRLSSRRLQTFSWNQERSTFRTLPTDTHNDPFLINVEWPQREISGSTTCPDYLKRAPTPKQVSIIIIIVVSFAKKVSEFNLINYCKKIEGFLTSQTDSFLSSGNKNKTIYNFVIPC